MSWTGQRGDGRRGYHHGNLREALIGAALDLIASKGASGFTIAEAARHAGVSPAAPYRHFRDAEALLAAIALRGFDQLTAMLQQAWNEGHPNPASAFEAMGRAYLGFARDHPAYYQTMFESPLTLANFPDMQAASDRSFAALRQG